MLAQMNGQLLPCLFALLLGTSGCPSENEVLSSVANSDATGGDSEGGSGTILWEPGSSTMPSGELVGIDPAAGSPSFAARVR